MMRILSVIALVALAARAQEPTLKVGSDAPPLTIAKWLKGDAVTLEKGKIYVVDFWTTSDDLAMPRLSELQDTYAGKVTFIGVTTAGEGNTLEAVEAMVKDKGPAMGYAVAWDDGAKSTSAWLTAAGVKGPPCSFIVDGSGKIAFIQHPLVLDFPLARLVAGKWDPVKGPEEMAAGFRRANELLQMDRGMALAAFPAFEKEYPELAATEAIQSRTARSLPAAKLRMLLLSGKNEEATALGTKLAEKAVKYNDPTTLNEVAWLIVDPDMKIAKRDLDLAMNAATKAVECSKGENASILDTLARVHYWKGDLAKAIEIQTKAVELAQGDQDEVDALQPTLDQYRAEAAAKKE
jgi:hypothetical protein